MNDEQIANAYINWRLSTTMPSKAELDYMAGETLTPERQRKIGQRIVKEANSLRSKYIVKLAASGIDVPEEPL